MEMSSPAAMASMKLRFQFDALLLVVGPIVCTNFLHDAGKVIEVENLGGWIQLLLHAMHPLLHLSPIFDLLSEVVVRTSKRVLGQ